MFPYIKVDELLRQESFEKKDQDDLLTVGDPEGWEAVLRIQLSFRSIELKWDQCS